MARSLRTTTYEPTGESTALRGTDAIDESAFRKPTAYRYQGGLPTACWATRWSPHRQSPPDGVDPRSTLTASRAAGGCSVLAGRMPTSIAASDGCVFCDIAGGQAETSLVHEDEDLVAFMDLAPVTPGHLLVVPRRHAIGLADLPEDLGMAMFRLAQRLSAALRRSGLRCEGTNLFLADGEAAGQEVFHVHLHVFPRYDGDSFRMDADWRTADRLELESSSQAVRRALVGEARDGAGPRIVAGPSVP